MAKNFRVSLHQVSGILIGLLAVFLLSTSSPALASDRNYVSIEEAVEIVRSAMLHRKHEITLYVQCDEDLAKDDLLYDLIFYPAFRSSPGEAYGTGDYLRVLWRGYTASVSKIGRRKWLVEFYDLQYRTSLEQEREFKAKLSAQIEELDIWTASDALKCQYIYEYITSTVSYDYDAYNGLFPEESERRQLSYTAYGALFRQQAVCTGYAHLFYAMAADMGLPVRIIRGEALGRDGWGAHAWNAVELDGSWYQLDCTWDAGDAIDEWEYFLKGSEMPEHHIGEESSNVGPISPTDYTLSADDYMPVCRFRDVQATDPCYEAVNYLSGQGILTGTTNGYTFDHLESVSRGMCVEVLYRLAGRPASVQLSNFTDVAPDAYYWEAVQWATANGIISGYQDGSFHPNDGISFEQMITMGYRYARLMTSSEGVPLPRYYYWSDISDYAQESMFWAYSADIISWEQMWNSTPSSIVTRGTLAEVIYAIYQSIK